MGASNDLYYYVIYYLQSCQISWSRCSNGARKDSNRARFRHAPNCHAPPRPSLLSFSTFLESWASKISFLSLCSLLCGSNVSVQKEVNQKKGRKGKGAGAGAGDGDDDDDEQEKEEGEQERRAKDGQSSPGEFLPHLPASANRQTESGQGGKERGGGRGERSRLSGTTGEEEVRHSPLPPSLHRPSTPLRGGGELLLTVLLLLGMLMGKERRKGGRKEDISRISERRPRQLNAGGRGRREKKSSV